MRIKIPTNIRKNREFELVPYSLRHFMITYCVMIGYKVSDIAKMCGKRLNQIE